MTKQLIKIGLLSTLINVVLIGLFMQLAHGEVSETSEFANKFASNMDLQLFENGYGSNLEVGGYIEEIFKILNIENIYSSISNLPIETFYFGENVTNQSGIGAVMLQYVLSPDQVQSEEVNTTVFLTRNNHIIPEDMPDESIIEQLIVNSSARNLSRELFINVSHIDFQVGGFNCVIRDSMKVDFAVDGNVSYETRNFIRLKS